MKQNVFEVLMYLFENYLYNEEEPEDRDSLESELHEAGFSGFEIRKAFEWLDALADSRSLPASPSGTPSIRLFGEPELMRLDTDTRGFILYLEQAGILTPESRELVLDRILALDDHEVDLDTVKWVILMVLFNRPGEEEAYTWMENLMFDVPTHLVH
ncbi:protein of unknown function Smg [Halorhodospira halochloris]|uniref:Protein Smg homolog n=1 Tax=Halorhodospira halochloris TaxID=1052 RepID=A0A0X8X780_HALHR|nr:DUF494 domain-containing protein [Halorhodospira halochloris]MBK1650702.1 hypothetical protein [Halorhodospira halochloris]BAU56809.2 protein of unknown function Smg [Halorhodospira halochloris]